MLNTLGSPLTAANPMAQRPNAGLLPPGQSVNPLGQDGFKASDALKDPNNPANAMGGAMMAQNLAGSLFDGILASQAQQLLVAAVTGQGDVQQMGQQLMKDYQQAKEMGAVLSPKTEQLVQQALQLVQGQQQGQGAGAPQGGAPQGGGAPEGGGGAPQGGGGAPQGGGGAPQGGGEAPQGGGAPQGPQGGEAPRPTRQASAPRPADDQPDPAQEPPQQAPPAPPPSNNTGTQSDNKTVAPPDASTTAGGPAETRRIGKMEDRVQQAGPQNNCGATAIVNAMQQMEQSQSGWGEGMKIEKQPDGTTKVTMRDGYSTTLTDDQLEQAAEATGYKGDQASVDRANTYMGAAANRYAQENNSDYGAGLKALNSNNWPGATQHTTTPQEGVDKYFGVQAKPVKDLKTLDGEGVAIVANGTHTDVARTSKVDGKTYLGDHGSRNNGRSVPYDGNIYSNGQSTGPATEAWTIQDRPKAGQPAPEPVKTQTVNYTPPADKSNPTVQLASYTPSSSGPKATPAVSKSSSSTRTQVASASKPTKTSGSSGGRTQVASRSTSKSSSTRTA